MKEPNVVIEKLEMQLEVAGDGADNEFAVQLRQHFPLLVSWLEERQTAERIARTDRALGDQHRGEVV